MKISNIIRSNLAFTYQQGEKVRDRIIKKLYHGKRATVDCGGLVCMTTHFLYPIADLVLLYPKEYLVQHVRFTNISKSNADLLQRCIDNTLRLKENDTPPQ